MLSFRRYGISRCSWDNRSDLGSVPRSRIPGLDLLRGLAALAVLWFHFAYAATFLNSTFPGFDIGAYGVEVFFTISGYVILMTAYRAKDRRAFAVSRFIRLYPGFIACMSLTTAWVLYQGITPYQVSPAEWALNLTMVPRWLGARAVDGVYWSLKYEIAFYAVVWAALPWIRRKATLWLCAASLPIAWALPLIAFFILGVVLHEGFMTFALPGVH